MKKCEKAEVFHYLEFRTTIPEILAASRSASAQRFTRMFISLSTIIPRPAQDVKEALLGGSLVPLKFIFLFIRLFS